jgi:hypothetical protein
MPISCWIPKSTNTRSKYVIFIAFPLQQRLRERASMLLCTYVTSIVTSYVVLLNNSFHGRQCYKTLDSPSCFLPFMEYHWGLF